MSDSQDFQLLSALKQALQEQWPAYSNVALAPLKAKGLAHDHVRIVGTGWLARIPKQSQMRLKPQDNLDYQQACFDRVSAAGHAPQCIWVLKPCASLPRGALIVQEIAGRAARLPQDLPLMVLSTAAMHSLTLPSRDNMAPLIHAADPMLDLWHEVQAQAIYLPQAHLSAHVIAQIQDELAAFEALCRASPRPMQRLIAFDGHPGNFVIKHSDQGMEKAYLVDLEKCRYSYPGLDLAHATLYTSTTWDIDSHTILGVGDVMNAYIQWERSVDANLACDARTWHLPLRRAMWLWSITWCAKWRVASRQAAAAQASGEDWSDENLDPHLAAHVRERVDHYLSADGVDVVRTEFAQLAQYMASESLCA